MRPVGYYVHHHGAGHRERASLVAHALCRPCTLIGTFAGDLPDATGEVLDLADDRLASGFDGQDGEATRPMSLHYGPLGHPGVRDRMAAIAAWIADRDPAAIVVDVSVEVAMLARLLSAPTLVVRLAGDRTDPPHLDAFRGAARLVAPFPAILDHPATPDWVRTKTVYAGFIGRDPSPTDAAEDGRIVVLCGRGGVGPGLPDLAAAARAVPDRKWHVLGRTTEDGAADLPGNLHLDGWVDDVEARLARAALVVGGCGDGTVAAVARAGKRFVCLPEARPYDEQVAKADMLARLGAALVLPRWPEPSLWPSIVTEASGLDPGILAGLADPDGVARIARAIEAVAAAGERRAG